MTFDQLYGAANGSAPAAPTAPAAAAGAAALITHPRYTTADAPYPLAFTARSLLIDNLSGVWYTVAGFDVPPWTLGMVVQLDVPSAQIAVEHVATPTGLTESTPTPAAGYDGRLSLDFGRDLRIVAYEAPLAPTAGRVVELVPQPFLHATVVVAQTGGTTTIVASPSSPARRLVPLRVRVAPYDTFAIDFAGLRGIVWMQFLDSGGGERLIPEAAISPELPTLDLAPPPAGWVLDPGVELEVNAVSEEGAGGQALIITVYYYEVGA